MVPGSQALPPPGRSRPTGRAPAWARLRWQLVGVGLAAVVLHVAVVSTAVVGLRDVESAHAGVADIVTAQRHFQDADMAHDAIRADALMLLARAEGSVAPAGPVAADVASLEHEVATFRTKLRQVDEVDLPPELEAAVTRVRPLQEQYAADAERLAAAVDDLSAARTLLDAVERQHQDLVLEQGVVTELMSAEAGQRRADALADERDVRWRVTISAAAALAALVGLTTLLHRMGRTVDVLLARERGVAETLQQSLLPDRLPDLPGARFAARYLPGDGEVGGDWYDVIDLPGGCVGLVMGDVVGHDIVAAADMGQLRNALLAYASEGGEPEDVLQRLNRLCVQHGLGEMATVVYAVLDPVTGAARVASAGHYPPLLVTPEGSRLLEPEPGPPVGAVREASYSSTCFDVPAGSLLLMYTDGLVERRGQSVDQGLDRLVALVDEDSAGTPPAPGRDTDRDLERVCDDVLAGMLDGSGPDDDIALLLVSVRTVLGPHLDLTLPARAERLVGLRQVLQRWAREVGADDEEAYDIVVACSEAATNAIEHAYGPGQADFQVVCDVAGDEVTVVVRDWGRWREARGTDRGRGTGLMQGLMDEATVTRGDHGTEVVLRRRLAMTGAGASQRPLVH